ncbi:MAG: 4Fe-4S binding protein [Thermoguttaceae bacterium]
MNGWRRIAKGALARRIVQTAVLVLFFGLVLWTRRRADVSPSPWLQVFFLIDPLLLLLTWLSAHAAPVALLASLITLAVTLVLGRVFCGWICPFGTLNAIAGRFLDFCWPRPKGPEHWSRWQLAKYFLLTAIVVMAACGVHAGAMLDPIVFLYRTTAVGLLPGVQWAVEDGSYAVAQSDPVRQFLRENVTEVERQAFLGSQLILALFVGILALNYFRRRFWCRYICPLGALLGGAALRPLLRRRVRQETCNQCDLCGLACHGAAAAAPGDQWNPAECFGCLNCIGSCTRQSISFALVLPREAEPPQRTSATAAKARRRSRRRFLRGTSGATAAGVAGLFLFRATPQSRGSTSNPFLIRPPGSLPERDFLKRCTACGMCMKICPTGCLQPAWTEAGLEGLWTPRVAPRIGRCEYDCTLCGQVCPTGAIARLSTEEKHEIRLGIATIDHSRCIPYAYGRDCGTCVEACPISPKAIRLVDVEVQVHDGRRQRTKIVSQPMVDPDRCLGCGGCVKECTFKDEPAIHVTSANESRHPAIKPFLSASPSPANPPPAPDAPY